MYLSPWKFFRNQILLDYSGRWRNQSCQIFFQSVHPGVSGKGSNFAIFSANRRWPLQLLYYRTTVMIIIINSFHSKHDKRTYVRIKSTGYAKYDTEYILIVSYFVVNNWYRLVVIDFHWIQLIRRLSLSDFLGLFHFILIMYCILPPNSNCNFRCGPVFLKQKLHWLPYQDKSRF